MVSQHGLALAKAGKDANNGVVGGSTPQKQPAQVESVIRIPLANWPEALRPMIFQQTRAVKQIELLIFRSFFAEDGRTWQVHRIPATMSILTNMSA
jgi:hypothetical protein